MTKLRLRCLDWRSFCKGSLHGYTVIRTAEMRMTLRDVAVHQRNGQTWASPPSRPWIRDGRLVLDVKGRPQYAVLIEFDTPGAQRMVSRGDPRGA